MSIAEGKFELDLMRGYEESFRNRMSRVISLSYDCVPLNLEQYSQKVSEVFESMKAINPNDKDLNLFDDIILGKIEGQQVATNFKELLESIVGQISEEKLKAYLKQKSQQKIFGTSNKDKNSCIRQVKKLQSLQKYFDVQEITKKRKYNKLYSTAFKSLSKYLELYGKIIQSDPTTIEKAFEQYNIYNKDQKKFAQFAKAQEQSHKVIQKPSIVEKINSQAEPGTGSVIEEEHKIVEIQQIKQIKQNKQKNSPEAEAKTPIKSKPKKKDLKSEDPLISEVNCLNATVKQSCESPVKDKKNNQNQQKQQKEKDKTVKKQSFKLLTQFGFKKQKNVDTINKAVFKEVQKIALAQQVEQSNLAVETWNQSPKPPSIWDIFGQQVSKEFNVNMPQVSLLRQQFSAYRMESEQYSPEPHYTNVIITLSTIEYYDYMMQVDRSVDFREPFKKIRNVLYFEDESEEFEGESADVEVEEEDQEEDDELSEGNHTILSDDHLSNEELSSSEVNDLHLKIQYGKGQNWVINFVSRSTSFYSEDELQMRKRFQMISLQTNQQTPLRLDEEQQTLQFLMTCELWRDAYKLAHGHYGTKDSIIKDLSTLLPGVSKNWIDSMLRERSEKIGNQRFIKKDFIDDLKEKLPSIDLLLEIVLNDRNEELRKIRAQKNQQKDLKLEIDILQCTGSRYIVNLIKHLKEKGYKQIRRNYLIEFINQRKGHQWDKIKFQMNTMSRPIDQLIRNMPISEKVDEEVEVDDQEFKNIQFQGNHDRNANYNSSTIDKDELPHKRSQKYKNSKLKDKNCQLNQQVKNRKTKKSINRHTNSVSIYHKTKTIHRGRKTKNSLKTGIPSIEDLKKIKDDKNPNLDNQESDVENWQILKDELLNSSKQLAKNSSIQFNKQLDMMEENNKSLQSDRNSEIVESVNEQIGSIDKLAAMDQIGEHNSKINRKQPQREKGAAENIVQTDKVITMSNIEQ